MPNAIQTDAYGVPCEEVKLARLTYTAAEAVAASNTAVLSATAATGPCSVTLVAASAESDTLTIAFPATSADTPETAGLYVTLDAASDDNLAVTASDTTGQIQILLANSTASKNTATLIQAAVRAVTPTDGVQGIVKGVSVAAVVCTAAGNWNTAAVAEGASMTAVKFTGGGGETIAAADLDAQPTCCRAITATAGGTGADIGAVSVIVYGTNINDQAISETLTPFTVNTAGTKTGAKAFKTITSVFLPSHDGTAATVSIGYADILGLPYMFTKKPLCWATLNGVIETTAPTITVDADEIEKNTLDPNSSLNGTEFCIYMGVPEA